MLKTTIGMGLNSYIYKKRGAAYDCLEHNPDAILNWFNKYA